MNKSVHGEIGRSLELKRLGLGQAWCCPGYFHSRQDWHSFHHILTVGL